MTLEFETQEAFAAWLDKNYAGSSGVWLRIARKGSGRASITYDEALATALCYGWIDGRKQSESGDAWLQMFSPRSKKSIWSKRNREKALALMEAGRMKPSGQAEVDRARADGRWEAAYDSQKNASVPPDLAAALDANPKAKAFFETLDSANRYAVLFRIHNVKKAETRANTVRKFVDMLEKHEKLHSK